MRAGHKARNLDSVIRWEILSKSFNLFEFKFPRIKQENNNFLSKVLYGLKKEKLCENTWQTFILYLKVLVFSSVIEFHRRKNSDKEVK